MKNIKKTRSAREKRKITPFRFAAFALIPVCMLAAVIVMNVVQAAGVSGNGRNMSDMVVLRTSGDNVRVTVGVDNAYNENITAVYLALNVDIEKGQNTAVFNFADGLSDTVNGSRYEGNTIYLFVAGQDVLFDEDDTLVLGELSLGSGISADELAATVSYKEGTLQVANSAFGSRTFHDVKTDAAKISRENTPTEPETSTEAPQPETSTEAPQPETSTEAPQPETSTEAPQPETSTSASQSGTTAAAGQNVKPGSTSGKSDKNTAESSAAETTTQEMEEMTSEEAKEEITEKITEIATQITTAENTETASDTQQAAESRKLPQRIVVAVIALATAVFGSGVLYVLYLIFRKKK